MSNKHIHKWHPVSKEADVLVNSSCVFVCECGRYRIKRMKQEGK